MRFGQKETIKNIEQTIESQSQEIERLQEQVNSFSNEMQR